ncbi:hypothetical protein ACL02R_26115 [Streptomyces sp. MS19]|uniref:hypothetical protein n=1 Tax=Streptomyces sp. MS19 TaxID=3385972 RepID=UPI0039A11953
MSGGGTRGGDGGMRRHRFEPWRLVLGLTMIGIAVVHLVRLRGDGDGVPLIAVFVLAPAALLLSGAVAAVTFTARRTARAWRVRRGDGAGISSDGRTGAGSGGPGGG